MNLRVDLGKLVRFSTVAVVLLFGAVNFFWIRRETVKVLAAELETRARHHAETIAGQTVAAGLLERKMLLKELVDDALSLDPAISYIFVVDGHGGILAHTPENGLPQGIPGAPWLPSNGGNAIRHMRDTRYQEIVDFAAPILHSSAYVHVGIRQDLMTTGVRRVERAVGVMVAAFVFLGILASLAFSRAVTRPIEELAVASGRVNLDALAGAAGLPAAPGPRSMFGVSLETEVDRLTHAFQQMVRRLSAAYRDLENTRKQLLIAERLGTLGTLAAGLAHELNNPLAGIKNCLRRIQKEPENRDQLHRYASRMQESVERMQAVLRSLLDLARPRRPEIAEFALGPVVERVILLAGERLAEVRTPLRVEVDPSAKVVHADERLLEEVLLNLVLNACDSLKLRQQCEPDHAVTLVLRASRANGETQIVVEDNGVGVAPEDLPHLFDPFFTTKPRGEGTGLGLAISRDVVHLHGGEILVDSRPGEGASFKVVLPETTKA